MFFSNPCCSPCRCPFSDLSLLWVSQRWCWGAALEGWQGGSIGSEKGWNNFAFPVILQSWGYSYFPAVNWWWKLNDCASYWEKSCGGNHCSARKIFVCMSVVQNPLLHHFWRKQAMKSYSIVQTPTCTPLWGCRTCFHLLCFQQSRGLMLQSFRGEKLLMLSFCLPPFVFNLNTCESCSWAHTKKKAWLTMSGEAPEWQELHCRSDIKESVKRFPLFTVFALWFVECVMAHMKEHSGFAHAVLLDCSWKKKSISQIANTNTH